jgi:hypothetical protein
MSAAFEETHGPENDNSKLLVVRELRGGAGLRDGAGLRGRGIGGKDDVAS